MRDSWGALVGWISVYVAGSVNRKMTGLKIETIAGKGALVHECLSKPVGRSTLILPFVAFRPGGVVHAISKWELWFVGSSSWLFVGSHLVGASSEHGQVAVRWKTFPWAITNASLLN